MTNISQEPLAGPVRVSDLGELLAGLPVFFGFQPVESLIVICLEGPKGRVGFRLRVDLPPIDVCDSVADYLVEVLRRNAAASVIVVARSDEPAVADPMVAAMVARLGSAAIDVREAVRCDGSRYWSYVCGDPGCCPPEGHEYDEGFGRLVAEAVWAGMELLPDRAALAARVEPVAGADLVRMEDATGAAAAEQLAALGDRDPSAMLADRRLLETWIERVRSLVDTLVADPGRPLTDAEAAQLSVWCSLDVVRDAVWSRIDAANAVDQLRVWTDVARRVVPPYELPILGLAAFSAWLSGDGALAWCAVERADGIDPDYPMTGLLRELLLGATPPATWVPPSEEPGRRRIRDS